MLVPFLCLLAIFRSLSSRAASNLIIRNQGQVIFEDRAVSLGVDESMGTLKVSGAFLSSSKITCTAIDTGDGGSFNIGQNVRHTDSVHFAFVNSTNGIEAGGQMKCSGIDTGYGSFQIGQNVRTTDTVTFGAIESTSHIISTGISTGEGIFQIGQNLRPEDSVIFDSIQVGSPPTDDRHAATKKYVDDLASGLPSSSAPGGMFAQPRFWNIKCLLSLCLTIHPSIHPLKIITIII